jgi:hypothetical protein
MAFLGTLLTLISGGVLFADTCKTASMERETRETATREGRNVWVDNKGNYRLVGTNEPCYIYNDKLKSLKDGRVIIDYGKERIKKQNDEAIAKAKAEGKPYCYLRFPEFSEDNRVRYLTEIETGKRYYLSNYGTPRIYKKYYYSKGHAGIATMLNDWEDEWVILTEEEYRQWGGYSFEERTGVYFEEKGKVLI